MLKALAPAPRVWLPPRSAIRDVVALGSTVTCPPLIAWMNPLPRFSVLPLAALSSAPRRVAVAGGPHRSAARRARRRGPVVRAALSRQIKAAIGGHPVN